MHVSTESNTHLKDEVSTVRKLSSCSILMMGMLTLEIGGAEGVA